MSVLDGCVLWGSRVVVPPPGRQSVLGELHDTHLGASKMKSLARAYIWWPKMDNNIENLAKSCHTCQQSSAHPTKAPLHPWEWPSQPWSRLHLDFAGPFLGHMYLVLVDAHSKWLDVQIMQSTISESTIRISLLYMGYLRRLLPTTDLLSPVLLLKISWTGMVSNTFAQHHITPPQMD